MRAIRYSLCLLSSCFLAQALQAQANDFQPLFDGKSLHNWVQITGSAPYTVEKGELVGTAVVGSPNSFLCTDRPYGNFVLTFSFWVEAPLNAGVMFRAAHRAQGEVRQIYGYQMEIDPLPRAYTGGLYDEARRGWIYPLHYHEAARQAYLAGAWNEARIEAIGHELRIFINGINTANLVDDLDASGLICLQVHSISPGDLEGKRVKWRDMQIKEAAEERGIRQPGKFISLILEEYLKQTNREA